MSNTSNETKKNKRCKKGTRKNPKTGNCDPIVKPESGIIEQIKDSVLKFHPIEITKPKPQDKVLNEKDENNSELFKFSPPLEQKQPEQPLIECSKKYVLLESDLPRYEEIKNLTGQELRDIHYKLTNDPSVIRSTKGVKTKEELIRLIICLENNLKVKSNFQNSQVNGEEPIKEEELVLEPDIIPKKRLRIKILKETIENEEKKNRFRNSHSRSRTTGRSRTKSNGNSE